MSGMDYDEALKKYGYMIYKYMPSYKIYGYTLDDMINIGRFVLWRCCQQFDESKGVKFSTYFVNSMKRECWSMNRLANMEKRKEDKNCIGIHLPCGHDSDITYLDVVENLLKEEESLESAIKRMLELIETVYEKDRPILRTFIYTRLYVNDEYTRKDLCQAYDCSYIKVRRILDDFRYLIKKEWGI